MKKEKNKKEQLAEEKKDELKKKRTFPERLQDCEDEDLDLDDLMDIAGGEEPESAKVCGLGCYLKGMNEIPESQNTQNGQIEL